MADRLCPCGEPLPDERTICTRCTTQTSHHLGDMQAHYEKLVTALSRQVRMQAPNDGSRGTDITLAWKRMGDRFIDTITTDEMRSLLASIPPQQNAAQAIHDQRQILVQWCRLLHEERGIELPRWDTIRAISLHLEAHLHHLHTHEAAGELVAEIRGWVARMWRIIDTPENRTRITVGPCIAVIADTECQGEVEAIVPHDETVPPKLRCRECRTEWGSEQWTRTGALINRKKERAA